MKHLAILCSLLFIIACSDNKDKTVKTTDNSAAISKKNEEIDSLKSVIATMENHSSQDSQTSNSDEGNHVKNPTENENYSLKDLSGKHGLTLQWISWEKPGTIHFTKVSNNTYTVSGSQKNGKDYLRVEGEIVQISDKKLQFEGTVESFIQSNGGKCLRTGPQTFLVTQNRKYWRMQNMVECFGLTDYVDIYF